MGEIEFTDRYSATGTPYPTKDSCHKCDAMRVVPVKSSELNQFACSTTDKRLLVIGQLDSDGEALPDDGWVFVQCPSCKGARLKETTS